MNLWLWTGNGINLDLYNFFVACRSLAKNFESGGYRNIDGR